MIPRADLSQFASPPLGGLLPGAGATLVAASNDHDTICALAQVADKPNVVEHPSQNPHGIYRLFVLDGGGDRRKARL